LAAAVVPLTYLPDRFLDAAGPRVAMPGKHVIGGEWMAGAIFTMGSSARRGNGRPRR
jgi:hypothetical protein